MSIDPSRITTAQPAKPRPTRRRTRKVSSAELCDRCGDELAIFWRGRAWCVTCDARLLFGDDDEGGEG